MLRELRVDLHVHTCLSPCGELEMSPEAIVRTALQRGLDGLAICDHNSAENVPAVRRAAEGTDLKILAGIEATTEEEVHVLALFDDWMNAEPFQEAVYINLDGRNDPESIGWQVVVNREGEVTGFNPKLLIGATGLSLDDLINGVHRCDGLAIAAHIDRESFSLTAQLGFVPAGTALDAVELSPAAVETGSEQWREATGDYPLVTGSDAHRLEDVARVWTGFMIEELNVDELRLALKGESGRRIIDNYSRKGVG